MNTSIRFAVVGGDLRQAKLAEMLAADGHSVSVFALDRADINSSVTQAVNIHDAISGADCVVLPLPALSSADIINTPLSDVILHLDDVLSLCSSEQLICGGRLEHPRICDYFVREELAVLNAAATAEGAIQLAMEAVPITMLGSKILVIGFGRIGKILSHRLRSLGADVTVSARKYADMSWIQVYGYHPVRTDSLLGNLRSYDMIFNTVPAKVLAREHLEGVAPSCLLMDLASKPGGMDFSAASQLGLKAIWALSLPGEVAPLTSGAFIRDTIYNILQERESSL